ncbi:MAG: hypothetical protein WCH99_04975 [Verrucomicrobiota bacterium]
MKCEKCGEQIDITKLEVKPDSIAKRHDEPEIEVGLKCKCGADYATFVSPLSLTLMN